MNETYLIQFPTRPYKELTPNFKRKHHWSRYSTQAKDARIEARVEAARTYPGASGVMAGRVVDVWITYGWPGRGRTPDEDNAIGWTKHYIDGLADYFAGGEDRLFRYAGLRFERVPPAKGVLVATQGWWQVELVLGAVEPS
jgi:hypothetical protein